MQTTHARLARALPLVAACVTGALVAGCSAPSHPEVIVPPIPDGPVGGGGGDGGLDAGTPDSCTPDPGQTGGTPRLGAHTLAFYGSGDDTNFAPLVSPAMTTQPPGSTIVLGIGRGNKALFDPPEPVDNKNSIAYPRCG